MTVGYDAVHEVRLKRTLAKEIEPELAQRTESVNGFQEWRTDVYSTDAVTLQEGNFARDAEGAFSVSVQNTPALRLMLASRMLTPSTVSKTSR